MTLSDDQPESSPAPARASRWPIFLPFAILLAVAAAWSAFWFAAAGKAEAAVDGWLAREAARDRIYACANRRIIGFPFRVELICDQPSARLPGDGGSVVATGARLLVVAQVYDPRRLIAEVAGPVEIVDAQGGHASLSFSLAQASAYASPDRLDRTSLSLTAPRLVVDGAEVGAAQSLQAHLRRAPDGRDGVYDLAARLDGGVSPLLDALPLGAGPMTLELQAEARGMDDLRPRPTSERLRAFAEADGRVHVALARIARGEVAAQGRGDFGLDRDGRLEGAFEVTARGVDGAVQSFLGGGRSNPLASLLGAGAALLGAPARLDDRPATTYPVKIDKGKIAVGPIKVARLPPLF